MIITFFKWHPIFCGLWQLLPVRDPANLLLLEGLNGVGGAGGGGGPHVGCRLEFQYCVGCRLKVSTFVGCR